uniref:BioF2-like acetyltransferase domain-containing protein n=3 Tax=Oryza nivara TaxID=4536 RepID=A0A0E0H191_ORYNI
MASPAVATRHPSPSFFGPDPRRRRGHSPSNLGFRRLGLQLKVTAIFGWIKGDTRTRELNPSAESYTLTGSASEADTKPREVSVAVVSSIMDIPSADWDACAVDSVDPDNFNPFLTHAFLSSLEESGSAVKETGWLPLHVVARDENETVVGVVPLYLKSHSRGEFVFDQSWAEAYYSYGLEYYPKLQSCVPFTPVTGQRILLRDTPYRDQVFEALVKELKSLTTKLKVSSLHITFPSEGEFSKLKDSEFLQRIGMQYHWRNRDYRSFDEFLMDLKQPKRKNIRQERKKIPAQNLKMKRLRGDEIKSEHWDTFYKFYRNTTDNHWGRPYLTREFFHRLGEKMGDKVMLIVAEHDDKHVAGALNLIGGDTLFGRLWGCLPDAYFPNLHFEACYYQAIEAAIELNLSKVEAGAQGEHKIQRGYLPVTTYSCHYFLDPGFGAAIGNYLTHETAQVKHVIKVLHDSGPYKEDILNEFLLTQGDGVRSCHRRKERARKKLSECHIDISAKIPTKKDIRYCLIMLFVQGYKDWFFLPPLINQRPRRTKLQCRKLSQTRKSFASCSLPLHLDCTGCFIRQAHHRLRKQPFDHLCSSSPRHRMAYTSRMNLKRKGK